MVYHISGDLHASKITMPDEERIDLMILVKEGKLSAADAVEKVKLYESRRSTQCGATRASLSYNGAPSIISGHHRLLSVPKPCNVWKLS